MVISIVHLQKGKKMKLFKRNPCAECDYYIKENNTCQSKKVSTYGSGYVSFIDRMFCEPYKGEKEKQEKEDAETN